MKTLVEPEDAMMEARRARHNDRPDEEQFYLGYASGLTEAYHGARHDPALRASKSVYASGYKVAYDKIAKRGEVGSRALGHMGRPMPRAPLFAETRRRHKKRSSRKRSSRRSARRSRA